MSSFQLLFFRSQTLFLCLALSLLCSLPAYSQKPAKAEDVSDKRDGITVVVDLAGKVEMVEMEGAKPKPAEKGARVPVGATFLVGPNSRLDLALSNGALFQLGENSKFTIGEFEQEAYEFVFTNGAAIRPREIKDFGADEAILQTMDASEEAWNKLGSEPTTSKGKFILSEGTMIGQSKKLKPGSRMEIVTPIGTAGIRGTVWMLTVKPVGGPGGTRFQGTLDVAEGRVDFGKTDGSRNVQVQGGYTATFDVTVTPSGEVRITNINTSPMPPERQAALLGTVSDVAQQQTYFTAVNGNPDALREAIRANAQTQAQGEGTNQPTDPNQTDANPDQIGISDLPPVIPTNPTQPPPPPRPTPEPPSPTSPTATPSTVPGSTNPAPNPTPLKTWSIQDLYEALGKATDQELLTYLKIKPEQLEPAKEFFQEISDEKITSAKFEEWIRDYFTENHKQVDLDAAFEQQNITSLGDFGDLIDKIELDREKFIEFLEAKVNPTPTPTPTPSPTPNPSNA